MKKGVANLVGIIIVIMFIISAMWIFGPRLWKAGKQSVLLYSGYETCPGTGKTIPEYQDEMLTTFGHDLLNLYSEFITCFPQESVDKTITKNIKDALLKDIESRFTEIKKIFTEADYLVSISGIGYTVAEWAVKIGIIAVRDDVKFNQDNALIYAKFDQVKTEEVDMNYLCIDGDKETFGVFDTLKIREPACKQFDSWAKTSIHLPCYGIYYLASSPNDFDLLKRISNKDDLLRNYLDLQITLGIIADSIPGQGCSNIARVAKQRVVDQKKPFEEFTKNKGINNIYIHSILCDMANERWTNYVANNFVNLDLLIGYYTCHENLMIPSEITNCAPCDPFKADADKRGISKLFTP